MPTQKSDGTPLEPASQSDRIGEGDTYIVQFILPNEIATEAFQKIKNEVQWQTMHHHGGEVPRLVAVEGQINEDGSFPIYRHPSDESPPLLSFSPTVSLIQKRVEEVLQHPVNHVLIQYYRTGNDYISEHSDKTIDVVRDSKIVNVSLGAERVMVLRTKKDALGQSSPSGNEPPQTRTTQRIPLPHNSMFVLGLETNAKWLHGIRQDKRLLSQKYTAQTAFDGERISLTFRRIGTFLTKDETHIFGQGAKGKTKEDIRPVIAGDKDETSKMVNAFGKENQTSDFDWDATYGQGFDVLHFTVRSPDKDAA